MESLMTLLITQSNNEEAKQIENLLSKYKIRVSTCEKDGNKVFEALMRDKPAAVLMDAFMPGIDAISVKKKYDESGAIGTTFFVTGSFSNDNLEQEIMESGFSYYFLKPFDINVLANRVIQSVSRHIHLEPQVDDECTVTEILHQIGVPAHIKGYKFLRDAILMTMDDNDYINSVTKRLYPEIARRNSTTASRVERAIRHAIEVAWDRGDVDTLNGYFGYTIHNLRGKPTNSEFIAMISDKMRLSKKQQLRV